MYRKFVGGYMLVYNKMQFYKFPFKGIEVLPTSNLKVFYSRKVTYTWYRKQSCFIGFFL